VANTGPAPHNLARAYGAGVFNSFLSFFADHHAAIPATTSDATKYDMASTVFWFMASTPAFAARSPAPHMIPRAMVPASILIAVVLSTSIILQ